MSDDQPAKPDSLHNDSVFERFDLPIDNPVRPEQLTLDSEIQFRCHKGVSCFNACCMSIDITLTPWDIVRFARNLDITTTQFINAFTEQFDLDPHGMPGLKLKSVDGGSACQFVRPEGCSVYAYRPTACRYYPLGMMGMRRKDSGELEDLFFKVQEPHCKGHEEPRTITVRDYRIEQQVGEYDDMNREWIDIIVKKRSAGPTVGSPSQRSFQLFYMASYDLDGFRQFVQSSGFQAMFELPAEELQSLQQDDAALLRFAMRFLKQVLFGELSIPQRAGAAEQRYEQRKEAIQRKHKENIERYHEKDPRDEAESG